MRQLTPRSVALVLTSATLLRLTVAPYDWTFFAFVAWIPFLTAVQGRSSMSAAFLGWIHGMALNALALSWLVGVLTDTARLSRPEALGYWLLLIGFQGVCSALVATLLAASTHRGLTIAWAFPLSLIAAESINPAVFPWNSAVFLAATPLWTQLAEALGPLGLAGLLAWCNAGLYGALEVSADWRKGLARVALVAAALSAVALFGLVRLRQIDRLSHGSAGIAFGVVQGNLKPAHEETQDPAPIYRDASLALLKHQEPRPDVLVWPETAIFQPVRERDLYWFLREHAFKDHQSKARIDVPVLLGLNLVRDDGAPGGGAGEPEVTRTNTAIIADSSARILGRYDKRRLFPLTEIALVPSVIKRAFGLREGPELSLSRPHLSPGRTSQAPIFMQGHSVLVTICYEEVFHRDVWEFSQDSAPELFITLSSDSWFGSSDASSLHLTLARLRAIEHRRFFLRSTTTGETVLIAPSGEIAWRLPAHQSAAGVTMAKWIDVRSVYSRIGDRPWHVLVGGFLAFLLWPRALFGKFWRRVRTSRAWTALGATSNTGNILKVKAHG